MPRVLVTGMSGTGKSAVLAVLAARGVRTIDTDYDGWSVEAPTPDGSVIEQVWVEDKMTQLLSEPDDQLLVVSGTVSNQGRFYDRFDAVVLLSAPTDVLLDRLASRTDNAFGKHPGELARILGDIEVVQPLLQATSTLELDATRSVEELADRIETLARGRRER